MSSRNVEIARKSILLGEQSFYEFELRINGVQSFIKSRITLSAETAKDLVSYGSVDVALKPNRVDYVVSTDSILSRADKIEQERRAKLVLAESELGYSVVIDRLLTVDDLWQICENMSLNLSRRDCDLG